MLFYSSYLTIIKVIKKKNHKKKKINHSCIVRTWNYIDYKKNIVVNV